MKVTIRWREVNDYTSTIDVNDTEFGAYFAEVKQTQADAQMSGGWISEYLSNGDEDAWFTQTDTDRDYDGTAERYITDVVAFEGAPA